MANLELCVINLKAAINGGVTLALLDLARLAASMINSIADCDNAIDLYRQYLRYNFSPEPLFELGQLILKHKEHTAPVLLESLNLLIHCYRHEDCPSYIDKQIVKMATKLCDRFLNEYRNNFDTGITEEECTSLIANFSGSGK